MHWRSTSKRWWSSRTTRTGEAASGGRLPALRCGSSAVVRAFERPDVAFPRATQRRARLGGDTAPPPGAVDHIVPVRPDRRSHPAHRAPRKRYVGRHAAHWARVAVARLYMEHVAYQQPATPTMHAR